MSSLPDTSGASSQIDAELEAMIAACRSPCSPAPEPKAAKRAKLTATTPTSTIRWTHKMIETLLHAKAKYREFFLEAKNKTKLGLGWAKIVLDLKTKCDIDVAVSQVKNKYNALQAAYRQARDQNNESGNNPAQPKPACWEALVEHFGNRQGQAHQCLNSQPIAEEATISDKEEAEQGEIGHEHPIQRQREREKRERLQTPYEALGADIKCGLQDLGRLLSGEGSDDTVKLMLQNQQKLLEQTNQLLQDSKNQTAQLLEISAASLQLLAKLAEK